MSATWRPPLALVVCLFFISQASAQSIDPLLLEQTALNPAGFTSVVITYSQQPTDADLNALRALGIRGGTVLSHLPMVLTSVNRAQLDVLRDTPGIRSLYANRTFPPMSNKSRPFIGLNALRADAEVTARNAGLPVSGKDIGIAYVDTGIDATHPDLQLGRNVVQNVMFPVAEYSATEWPLPDGFTPVVAVEDQPMTDVQGGHGTFGAAVTAGTGQASGAFYGGVAPGAKLVGLVAGNDVGLTTFAIVQAFNYTLVNQFRYNIRVCNNSWGTVLADYAYDPLDPINTATRALHDNNIVVVFAAGNGIDSVGDVPGAINPFSVAPWVISVAAGEKDGLGRPAGFSSRGEDNGTGTDIAGQPADPAAPPNLRPDLIGSGVDIKSARSKGPGLTNTAGTVPVFVGSNDLTTIPPAFLPFYTTSQGTSFSTPQVSGVVALMLEANPTLTPDDIVNLLRQTATPMPYDERVVGAGYVDARNAVRAAFQLSAVDHPANLFPDGPQPEIIDTADDQLGTQAQDIRSVDFAYDESTAQIVYTLTVGDFGTAATELSTPRQNFSWTISSNFGTTTVFVRAAITETGAPRFTYGRITLLPNGTRNQQNLGDVDAGSLDPATDRITMRLGVAKVNAAVGSNVLFTTSTQSQAVSQFVVGTSVTGGLLLAADAADGAEWKVGEPPPPGATVTPTDGLTTTEAGGQAQFTVALTSAPLADVTIPLTSSDTTEGVVSPGTLMFTPSNWNTAQTVTVTGVNDSEVDGSIDYQIVTGPATSTDSRYSGFDAPNVSIINADDDTAPPPPPTCETGTERLVGTTTAAAPASLPVGVTCTTLEAQLSSNPGNAAVALELVDAGGNVVGSASGHKKMKVSLEPGQYTYRVTTTSLNPVDFVIKSTQGK